MEAITPTKADKNPTQKAVSSKAKLLRNLRKCSIDNIKARPSANAEKSSAPTVTQNNHIGTVLGSFNTPPAVLNTSHVIMKAAVMAATIKMLTSRKID